MGEEGSLFRGEVDDQLPQGLASALGKHVPHGVVNGGGREGNDALLGAEPAVLRVADDCKSALGSCATGGIPADVTPGIV